MIKEILKKKHFSRIESILIRQFCLNYNKLPTAQQKIFKDRQNRQRDGWTEALSLSRNFLL